MKFKKFLETELPKYQESVESWNDWISIRDSGDWDPTYIGGDLVCSRQDMSSFIGGPKFVGGTVRVSHTGISSLEGAPNFIGGIFYCNHNKISTLKNVHKQIKHINGIFSLSSNPIMSNILGLLLIEKLNLVDNNHNAFLIINKHLQCGDRDVLECQEELISSGYKEFAKL